MLGASVKFRRTDDGIVSLSPQVVQILKRYRQVSGDASEAGGVLLGRLIRDARDVVVDGASEPDGKDQRFRFAFRRGRRPAQAIVDRAWRGSGGTCNYLGEWHTHPQDVAYPSELDRCEWTRVAREARYEQGELLFIIVGRVEVRCWQCGKNSEGVVELVQLSPS